MALWNDKRTPPGVVTNTQTGANGRMGAGNGGFTPDSTHNTGVAFGSNAPSVKKPAAPKKPAAAKPKPISGTLGDPAPKVRNPGRW